MASSPIITNIDVANLALSYTGNTSQINSFSDQTAPSIVCGRFYDVSRVSLLKSYPWSFATVVDTLTVTTETDDKYTYAYEYPSDCLRVLQVFAANDIETIDNEFIIKTAKVNLSYLQRICCDVAASKIRYVYDVQDVPSMPMEFIDALAYILAARIAVPLTSNSNLASLVSQQAMTAISNARKCCAYEQKIKPEKKNPYIMART